MQIGYLPAVMTETEMEALVMFSVMIDGGMSFPFFQIVRDQKGLCYQIGAELDQKGNRICHFEIYVGTDPSKYEEAQKLILDIIESSKNDIPLLAKARQLRLGRLDLASEGSANVLQSAAGSLAIGREPRTREQRIERIKSVTIRDVEKAVNKYLNPERMIRVLLKPKKS